MKQLLLALAFWLNGSLAYAEGPATGPSDQSGCANVPTDDSKQDAEKPEQSDTKAKNSETAQHPKAASDDCRQKQKAAAKPPVEGTKK